MAAAEMIFERLLGDRGPIESAFLAGDGALLYSFRDKLLARQLDEARIKIECFFNNPYKKIV